MTFTLPIIGTVVLLVIWGLAWRNQPMLAFGIFLGVVTTVVIEALVPASSFNLGHVPLWLPPLPFAVVAGALFCFGALAWWWGRGSS